MSFLVGSLVSGKGASRSGFSGSGGAGSMTMSSSGSSSWSMSLLGCEVGGAVGLDEGLESAIEWRVHLGDTAKHTLAGLGGLLGPTMPRPSSPLSAPAPLICYFSITGGPNSPLNSEPFFRYARSHKSSVLHKVVAQGSW